eukprot:TRINITY_DN1364_c0_g1_i1.p1 TRINITY_DN1364_c0_g1~~TRINITY_DN1364_c0_g1_i1.p1  ORF type:complete len:194 (+),score=38.36 TRINITY_DN1364_c0_g1_i1:63-644(+)
MRPQASIDLIDYNYVKKDSEFYFDKYPLKQRKDQLFILFSLPLTEEIFSDYFGLYLKPQLKEGQILNLTLSQFQIYVLRNTICSSLDLFVQKTKKNVKAKRNKTQERTSRFSWKICIEVLDLLYNKIVWGCNSLNAKENYQHFAWAFDNLSSKIKLDACIKDKSTLEFLDRLYLKESFDLNNPWDLVKKKFVN